MIETQRYVEIRRQRHQFLPNCWIYYAWDDCDREPARSNAESETNIPIGSSFDWCSVEGSRCLKHFISGRSLGLVSDRNKFVSDIQCVLSGFSGRSRANLGCVITDSGFGRDGFGGSFVCRLSGRGSASFPAARILRLLLFSLLAFLADDPSQ